MATCTAYPGVGNIRLSRHSNMPSTMALPRSAWEALPNSTLAPSCRRYAFGIHNGEADSDEHRCKSRTECQQKG